MDARTFNELCSLERDNFTFHDHWILSDGYNVSIHAQKIGEAPKQGITIPCWIFRQLIKRYIKPQRIRPSLTRAREGKR